MRTLAILSQKGGTGKTTVAVHLAVAAAEAGKRALLADLDPQKSASDWRRLRAKADPPLIEAKAGTLFVASHAAARNGADILVIDTRPAQDSDIAEAIRQADLCLLVLRPSFFDLKAIARTLEMTRAMGKSAMFLINQAPPRREQHEAPAVVETVAALRQLGAPLAPVGLRSRHIYQTAVAKGLVAQEAAPGSAAAREMGLLWAHVEQTLWAPPPPAWRREPAVAMAARHGTLAKAEELVRPLGAN